MIKYFILFSTFIFLFQESLGQNNIRWINLEEKKVYNINIESHEFSRAEIGSKFQDKIKISVDSSIKSSYSFEFLLKNFSINSKTYFITDENKVYEFNEEEGNLKKLNEGVDLGYSFSPFVFTYHDEIFSLGGTGMWNTHNRLIKFNFQTNEWEDVLVKGEQIPPGVLGSETSFDPKSGSIYTYFSISSIHNSFYPEFIQKEKSGFYKLDLAKMEWNFLGITDGLFLDNKIIDPVNFNFLGHKGYFMLNRKSYFIDFESNELREYSGINSDLFIINPYPLFYDGEKLLKLFTVGYGNNLPLPEHLVLNEFNLDREFQDSKSVSQLYRKPNIFFNSSLSHFTFIFALMFMGGLFYSFYKKTLKLNESGLEKNQFNQNLKTFLINILSNSPSKTYDANELNTMLNIDSKAFDTQRQYRSKLLLDFNEYMLSEFGIKNAVVRVPDKTDRRFVIYGINSNLFTNSKLAEFTKSFNYENE
ncbi:MAG: hypothetical protein RIR51_1960 [Bacteroidota bacterium]